MVVPKYIEHLRYGKTEPHSSCFSFSYANCIFATMAKMFVSTATAEYVLLWNFYPLFPTQNFLVDYSQAQVHTSMDCNISPPPAWLNFFWGANLSLFSTPHFHNWNTIFFNKTFCNGFTNNFSWHM